MDFTEQTSDINESNNPLYGRNFQKNFVEGKNSHIKAMPSHPLIRILDNNMEKVELGKLQEISMLFGSALAMERQIQRSIAGSNSRGSTFKTSNHALKLTMGLYDKIEFSDYLGQNKPFDVDQSLFYKADNSY